MANFASLNKMRKELGLDPMVEPGVSSLPGSDEAQQALPFLASPDVTRKNIGELPTTPPTRQQRQGYRSAESEVRNTTRQFQRTPELQSMLAKAQSDAEPGAFQTATQPIFDMLQIGQFTTVGFVQELLRTGRYDEAIAQAGVEFANALPGIELANARRPGWADIIKDQAIFGDDTPGRWAAGGLGFVLDVALDPLTYTGLGIGKAFKAARGAGFTLRGTAAAEKAGLPFFGGFGEKFIPAFEMSKHGMRGEAQQKAIDAYKDYGRQMASETESGIIELEKTAELLYAGLEGQESKLIGLYLDQPEKLQQHVRSYIQSTGGNEQEFAKVMEKVDAFAQSYKEIGEREVGIGLLSESEVHANYIARRDPVTKQSQRAWKEFTERFGIDETDPLTGLAEVKTVEQRVLAGMPTELDGRMAHMNRSMEHVRKMASRRFVRSVLDNPDISTHIPASEVALIMDPAFRAGLKEKGLTVFDPDAMGKMSTADLLKVSQDDLVSQLSGKKMGAYVMPEAIVDDMAKADQILRDDDVAGQFWNTMTKVQGIWKGYALLSPGYHLRNVHSNIFQNFLAGVTHPRRYAQALALQSRGTENLPSVVRETVEGLIGGPKSMDDVFLTNKGVAYTGHDLERSMAEFGVTGHGLMGKDLPQEIERDILTSMEKGIRNNKLIKQGMSNGGRKFMQRLVDAGVERGEAEAAAQVADARAKTASLQRNITPDDWFESKIAGVEREDLAQYRGGRDALYEKDGEYFRDPMPHEPLIPHGDMENQLSEIYSRNSSPTAEELSRVPGAAKDIHGNIVGIDHKDVVAFIESVIRRRDADGNLVNPHLWYHEFGENIGKAIGRQNLVEASAVFSIMSPQRKVENNLVDLYRIMRMARESVVDGKFSAESFRNKIDVDTGTERKPIIPPKKTGERPRGGQEDWFTDEPGTPGGMRQGGQVERRVGGIEKRVSMSASADQIKKIVELYETGIFGALPAKAKKRTGTSAMKTSNFMMNVYFTSQGKFFPFPVMDVQMARAMGVYSGGTVAKKVKAPISAAALKNIEKSPQKASSLLDELELRESSSLLDEIAAQEGRRLYSKRKPDLNKDGEKLMQRLINVGLDPKEAKAAAQVDQLVKKGKVTNLLDKGGKVVRDKKGQPQKDYVKVRRPDETPIVKDDETYRWMQYIVSKAGRDLNLSPDEAQAAMWFYGKESTEQTSKNAYGHVGGPAWKDEVAPIGTWASAEKFAEIELKNLQEVMKAKDIAVDELGGEIGGRYSAMPGLREPRIGFDRETYPLGPEWVERIPEMLKQEGRVIRVASKPGGFGVTDDGITWQEWTDFHQDFLSKKGVLNEKKTGLTVLDELGEELGFTHSVHMDVKGTKDGLEPGFAIHLWDADEEAVDFVSAMMGDALMQDSVAWYRPRLFTDPELRAIGEEASGGGLRIVRQGEKEFTDEELTAVNAVLEKAGLGHKYATEPNGPGLTFVNLDKTLDDEQFVNEVVGAMDELGIDVEKQMFRYRGELHESADYAKIMQRIKPRLSGGPAGSSDLQERIYAGLQRPFADALEARQPKWDIPVARQEDIASRRKGAHSKSLTSAMDGTDVLTQKEGGLTRGAVRFDEENKAIISLFENADASTTIHELGHIFRRDLDVADQKLIEDWAGSKDGWSEAAEEKFARGFERYVMYGEAPIKGLEGAFSKLKGMLQSIYLVIRGGPQSARRFPSDSPIAGRLSPEVIDVFDRMLGKGATDQVQDTSMANAALMAGGEGNVLQKASARFDRTFGRNSPQLRWNRRVGVAMENNARAAHFLQKMDGDDLDVSGAAASVRKYLFDYAELTEFEQKVMKNFIPFYTWSRKNIPLQVQAMMEDPGRYATIPKAIQNVEGLTQEWHDMATPDYYDEMAAVRLPILINSKPTYLNPNLPFVDLNRANWEDVLSSLSPILKLGVEQIPQRGYSIFQDRPIESYPGQPSETIPFLSKKEESLVSTALPTVGKALRAVRAGQRGELSAQAMSELLGIKLMNNDPQRVVRGQTYGQRELLRALKRKARNEGLMP